MLAVFFVILASVGLMLNWPVIDKGIMDWMTKFYEAGSPFLDLQTGSPAFLRMDGKVILVLSAIVLLSTLLRTTRAVLNLRQVVLAVILAVISAEMFMALVQGYPLSTFTGAIYSLVFYLMAFIAAIFRFGSVKSLNSTTMGVPMSESRAFSHTFGSFIGNAATALKVKVTARDKIRGDWNEEEEREFDTGEIRIGRDEKWADIVVGEEWPPVSHKHGVIRVIGTTVVYEPLTDYYAFAVDGKPYKDSRELPSQSVLTLVSGHGPGMVVTANRVNRSFFHPQTMAKVKEITSDEFKKLQVTFKVMVIVTLMALPLLWGFKHLQENARVEWENATQEKLNSEKEKKEEFRDKYNRVQEEKEEIKKQKEKNELQKERLEKHLKSTKIESTKIKKELAEKKAELERLRGKSPIIKVPEGLENAAKVIDIRFSSQRQNVYFPLLTRYRDGRYAVGTGFFAGGDSGKVYLITLKRNVYDTRKREWGNTFFFIYRNTGEQFEACHELVKNWRKQKKGKKKGGLEISKISDWYKVMHFSEKEWGRREKELGPPGIVKVEMKKIPLYLKSELPVIRTKTAESDPVAFYSCTGRMRKYAAGYIRKIDKLYIEIDAPVNGGLQGGPLIKVHSRQKYEVIGVHLRNNRYLKF